MASKPERIQQHFTKEPVKTSSIIVTVGRSSIEVHNGFDHNTFEQVVRILAEQC